MLAPQHRLVRLSLLLVVGASLLACGSLDSASNRVVSMVRPHKMDIVQGNFVSAEQLAAIKPGMSRLQVRDLLGTPLLASIFHADRWDYVFTFRRQGVPLQARQVTVYFKGDVLERIDADSMPSEAEFVASLDSGRKTVKVPVLEMAPDTISSRSVPAKPAETKPLPPLPASYPPLEPALR
jgi:outer membrane protein assembly factor BamE